jgi:hypothetical protein
MKGWGANMRGQYKRGKKNLIDAMQRLDSKEGLVGLDDLEWREVYPRKPLCRFILPRKLTSTKEEGTNESCSGMQTLSSSVVLLM